MKRLFCAMSPPRQQLLGFAAWTALIVLSLVSAPLLFELIGRRTDWIMGLFPRSDELWKEFPRCL